MNAQPASKKKLWITIAVIAIIALVYFYYNSSAVPDDGSLAVSDAKTEVIGAQVFMLLQEIQSLKIDGSIFKTAAYKTLQDYSVDIPEQAVGRLNPFAPL